MQVRALAEERDGELAAPGVVAIDTVHGLVHVADEMDEKHQRLCALETRLRSIRQHSPHSLDRAHDAIAARLLRAVAIDDIVASVEWDVDEVPVACGRTEHLDLIGPRRYGGKRLPAAEELGHFRERFGLQPALCKLGDDGVSGRAPGTSLVHPGGKHHCGNEPNARHPPTPFLSPAASTAEHGRTILLGIESRKCAGALLCLDFYGASLRESRLRIAALHWAKRSRKHSIGPDQGASARNSATSLFQQVCASCPACSARAAAFCSSSLTPSPQTRSVPSA